MCLYDIITSTHSCDILFKLRRGIILNKKKKSTTKPIIRAAAKNKIKAKAKNESVSLAIRSVKISPIMIVVLALWGIYVYISFTTPTNPQSPIQLSPLQLILLRLSVVVPYLLTWLAAAYSTVKIKRYALAIRPSKESEAFNNISKGIAVLMASLILSTFASSIRSYFAGYEQLRSVLTIITNYAYVFPFLIAFIFLLKGAIQLARQNAAFKIPFINYFLFAIPLIALAYVWLELIFSNQFRVIAGGGSQFASYYLKDSLLILTIVLPSLFAWIMGFLAVINLRMYYKKVSGILYKRALSSLFYGFVSVIFASIFFQALLSLGARRLLDLGLERLLALIYIFVFLQALGFFLISRGARKLTKIEAV